MASPSMRVLPLFSVEGNIAAGKGTLLEQLKQLADAAGLPLFIVPQLTQESQVWLNKLYSDMGQHAFSFQIHSITTQLRALINTYCQAARTPGAILLSERSLHSVNSVFTAALRSLGHMSEEQAALVHELSQTLQSMLQLLHIQERGYIYLQTSVLECAKRVQVPLSRDYLSVLDAVHTVMLQSRQLPCFLLEEGDSQNPQQLQALLHWMKQQAS